jgi:hypothetical protein
MPWKPSQATKFTKKAKSSTAKRQWRDVANGVRKKLLSKGVSAKTADAAAVRTANGVLRKRARRKKSA